jgi:hypothetical protein
MYPVSENFKFFHVTFSTLNIHNTVRTICTREVSKFKKIEKKEKEKKSLKTGKFERSGSHPSGLDPKDS